MLCWSMALYTVYIDYNPCSFLFLNTNYIDLNHNSLQEKNNSKWNFLDSQSLFLSISF